MTVASGGFIVWFEIYIYEKIRKACKNIYIKLFVHTIGLLLILIGLYYLIATMPSFASILGMLLSLVGFVFFLIPIGVKNL